MKVIEQFFPVMLFVMLYKVILSFTGCKGNPKVYGHSNENYREISSCSTVYCAVQRDTALVF